MSSFGAEVNIRWIPATATLIVLSIGQGKST